MQCMGQRRYKYYNKILLQVHNTNSRYAVPGRDRTEYLSSDLHKNYPWPSAHLVFTFFLFLLLFSLCENYYFLAIFKYKPAMAKKMADIFGRRFKDMFFNFSTFRILKA